MISSANCPVHSAALRFPKIWSECGTIVIGLSRICQLLASRKGPSRFRVTSRQARTSLNFLEGSIDVAIPESAVKAALRVSSVGGKEFASQAVEREQGLRFHSHCRGQTACEKPSWRIAFVKKQTIKHPCRGRNSKSIEKSEEKRRARAAQYSRYSPGPSTGSRNLHGSQYSPVDDPVLRFVTSNR
jgi:hypothetical protein